MNILIVDTIPVLLNSFATAVQMYCDNVKTLYKADNFEAASNLLKETMFDIVILQGLTDHQSTALIEFVRQTCLKSKIILVSSPTQAEVYSARNATDYHFLRGQHYHELMSALQKLCKETPPGCA